MLYNNSRIFQNHEIYYNPDKIIEFLDEMYDYLTNLKVSIFTYNSNKEFSMKLIQKLYDCGCQVTIISSTFDYCNARNAMENSNVVICYLNKQEVNGTFHPTHNSIILDITGESLNKDFLDNSKNSNHFAVYTS